MAINCIYPKEACVAEEWGAEEQYWQMTIVQTRLIASLTNDQ